jgi:(R,R)-butanediol dehydrogenase/meso-butanediol dehydrogenase/diacetyl reductase
MRAGIVTGKERFELIDVDDPAPGTGQVVVEIARCGICGSDVHAYQEGWPYAPGICGHEWTGTIVDRGPIATAATPQPRVITDGLRVVGAQAPGCGTCPECRADLPRFCRVSASEYSGKRAPTSGGFAPYLTLHANRLIPVPDGITDDEAALIEPASVAMHAVRRSKLAVGDVVCVVGCGPIGLMVIQAARLGGAGRVIAVEPNHARHALATSLGADVAVSPGEELRAVVNDLTAGLRADIAFDCAGIPQTLQQSVDMVRQGGSVCMVGVSGGAASIQPMRWMMKEVSVDTSILFTLDEMAICAELIAQGRIVTDGFIDGTVDLDALPATIDGLANRRTEVVKLLVDPTGG